MTQDKMLIVVTGGAGFVGSHLCKRLAADGHRVISLDNYFTGSRDNHVAGVEYREGHTKDIAVHVPETPDLIYHLGEYARVEKSFEDPIDLVWDLNMVGTFHVLEYWRAKRCKLVYAGSSTKFAVGGKGKFQSPYAWTKATNTELVREHAGWYGLEYAIAYFYNVFGPGERGQGPYATVIGIWLEQLKRGEPITLVAPGTQERNFTHVDDIVEGLVLVGERGSGDEYGIGNDRVYTMQEVAKLFDTEVVMLPERRGNREGSRVESEKTKALGWRARVSLEEYLRPLVERYGEAKVREKRVLVFSTTFHPVAGLAEEALLETMRRMPDVQFDIVTTAFTRAAKRAAPLLLNAHVVRVGSGSKFDKYLLPFLGARAARSLAHKHRYLFSWAVMASYGALAAVRARRGSGLPLLITLADQRLDPVPLRLRFLIRFILSDADQVSSSSAAQERGAAALAPQMRLTSSNRTGDAFANAARFLYNDVLRELMEKP